MLNSNARIKRKLYWTAACLLLVLGCGAQNTPADSTQPPRQQPRVEKEDRAMTDVQQLEKMIAEGDWDAVELAGKMGASAWPVLEWGAQMAGFRSRQITMVSAGQLGGDEAGRMLLAGLHDKHINVGLAAAGQLSRNPPGNTLLKILDELNECSEDNICALLALAVGRLPAGEAPEVLLELAEGDDDVAKNAQLALARLGNSEYVERHLDKLASKESSIRYEALSGLIYINDPKLARNVHGLLSDREVAVTLGTQYKPRHRRVCDQAVDTLTALLKIKPGFDTGPENIYTDEQLHQFEQMVKQSP